MLAILLRRVSALRMMFHSSDAIARRCGDILCELIAKGYPGACHEDDVPEMLSDDVVGQVGWGAFSPPESTATGPIGSAQ
eukprot:13632769-Alexandrium_andersonii.AAC.1